MSKTVIGFKENRFCLGERMFGETFLLPITDLGNDVSVPFVLKVTNSECTPEKWLGKQAFFGAQKAYFWRLCWVRFPGCFRPGDLGRILGSEVKVVFTKTLVKTWFTLVDSSFFKFSTFQLLANTYSSQTYPKVFISPKHIQNIKTTYHRNTWSLLSQGKSHEVRLSFWLNCLNASTLLAALAPGRIGFHERPHDVTTWAKLLHTAQLEVQGEILSLTEMEQVGVPSLSNHW